MKQLLAVTLLACIAPAAGWAQTPAKNAAPAAALPDHGVFRPADVKWMDAPNALPLGAKLAVLEGDPFKPGTRCASRRRTATKFRPTSTRKWST
jgi:hypothetical protein